MKILQNVASPRQAGFLPTSLSDLPDAVVNTRFVDELAMASRILCSFFGKFGVPWLDVWLNSVLRELIVSAAGVQCRVSSMPGLSQVPRAFQPSSGLKPWLGEIDAGKFVRWSLCSCSLRGCALHRNWDIGAEPHPEDLGGTCHTSQLHPKSCRRLSLNGSAAACLHRYWPVQ